MDFLSKITPGNVVELLSLIGMLIWHRKTTAKKEGLANVVEGLLRQTVNDLVNNPEALGQARELLTAAAWKGLAAMGQRRTAELDLIIRGLVEHAVADLAEEIDHRTQMLQGNLDRMATAAAKVSDAFTPIASSMPKLDLDIREVKEFDKDEEPTDEVDRAELAASAVRSAIAKDPPK